MENDAQFIIRHEPRFIFTCFLCCVSVSVGFAGKGKSSKKAANGVPPGAGKPSGPPGKGPMGPGLRVIDVETVLIPTLFDINVSVKRVSI